MTESREPGTTTRRRAAPMWKLRLMAVASGAGVPLVALVAIVGWLFASGRWHVDRIPPESHTYGAMQGMKTRIVRYARIHGCAPARIEDLPTVEGFDHDTTDGFGHPIAMEVEGDHVTLRSLGRDARPGGEGDDCDLVGVFALRDAQGEWESELVAWTVDPLFGS